MTYIDQAPDSETKVSLIKTLQAVTEGKVRRGARSRGARGVAWWAVGQRGMWC